MIQIKDVLLATNILTRIIEDYILPLLDTLGFLVIQPKIRRKITSITFRDGGVKDNRMNPINTDGGTDGAVARMGPAGSHTYLDTKVAGGPPSAEPERKTPGKDDQYDQNDEYGSELAGDN